MANKKIFSARKEATEFSLKGGRTLDKNGSTSGINHCKVTQ